MTIPLVNPKNKEVMWGKTSPEMVAKNFTKLCVPKGLARAKKQAGKI